jgi:uncharacterized protein (TIGR02611 family)
MHGDPNEPPRSDAPDATASAEAAPTEQRDGGRQRFQWFRDLREWIHARPHVHLVYKVLVGIVGGLIVIVGLALVPLPGPGWLVVFIGLTVLASEFHFFHRIITWLRAKLHRFWDWAKHHAPSKRMRAAADRGKADVDAAHAEAHRNVGVRPRGRAARSGL